MTAVLGADGKSGLDLSCVEVAVSILRESLNRGEGGRRSEMGPGPGVEDG